MMNILISVNTAYLDKARTMLHSLRRYNTEDITVFLMNCILNTAEIRTLREYLKKRLGMELVVIDVPKTMFTQLPVSSRFSIEIYYRVIAQFLLPQNVDRILWLDADIVICGAISEFYHQDFGDALLAVCPDVNCESKDILGIKENLGLPKEHTYFNSGVLLLNIEVLRKTTDFQDIVQTAQSIASYFVYPDQDLLNYLYRGRVKYCDQNKYNCQVQAFRELSPDQIKKIAILHYAGHQKPWLVYHLHDLSKAVIPYWKEIASQGKWLSVATMMILYGLWLVYDKTGISKIVRGRMK